MERLGATIKTLLASCGSAVLVLALLATPALGIEDGGVGGKPAHPRADNPRSESIFVYELKPGESVSDEVQVINNTSSEKTLQVYAVDSQVASGGAFSCAQKVDEPVSVGTWITMAKSEVVLAPQSFENVGFTVKLPATASVGESNGCIVIQDAQRSATSENGGVTLSFRTAIRVAVTVPGEIQKGLVFTSTTVKPVDGQKLRITTGLKNSGNVSLDAEIKANLQHILGIKVADAGGQFPVLAGSEATFNFEVDQPFWGGWYKVTPEAGYNSDVGSSIGESEANTTITAETVSVVVAPQPLAAVVELALVTAVVALVSWIVTRRHRLKQLHLKAKPYVIKAGDSLHSIAKEFNVSWRNIEKLNKLRPPYHLEPGRKIKLPHR